MPLRKLVSPALVLIAGNFVVATLLTGLSAAARPTDRTVYVAFPPWYANSEDVRRIVAAGGRSVDETAWPSVFKVVLTSNDGLTRLMASGAILAFAADRRPICASLSKRA